MDPDHQAAQRERQGLVWTGEAHHHVCAQRACVLSCSCGLALLPGYTRVSDWRCGHRIAEPTQCRRLTTKNLLASAAGLSAVQVGVRRADAVGAFHRSAYISALFVPSPPRGVRDQLPSPHELRQPQAVLDLRTHRLREDAIASLSRRCASRKRHLRARPAPVERQLPSPGRRASPPRHLGMRANASGSSLPHQVLAPELVALLRARQQPLGAFPKQPPIPLTKRPLRAAVPTRSQRVRVSRPDSLRCLGSRRASPGPHV